MLEPRRIFIRTRTKGRLLAVAMVASLIATAFAAWPASGFEIVGAAPAKLALERNHGRLVRLPRPASTVFIANPEIADIQVKSPSLIYLLAKAPGETTLFAVDARDVVLANIDVAVTPDLARLRSAIRELLPDTSISVNNIDGAIVLDGIVESATTAENIRRLAERISGSPEMVINRIGILAPNQVNLRVRVAEISREVDKQLGINWEAIGTIGGLSIGLATTNPFSANVTQHVLSLGGKPHSNWDLNAVVDALEDEGLVKVMAEPNLTALSGETASFLAGGEFPILVPDSDGRITIEFKKFGVSLAFTPTLIGDGQVNLHVRPEVSQLSNSNSVTLGSFEIPSLVTRRAETTVELGSGQSFAIAGLIQNNVTHDISKFPGLGDVPVLGPLFRSDRFQREESELVIIVTPYIVRPTSQAANLSTPTDGYLPPTDKQRYTDGGTHRRTTKKGAERQIAPDGTTLIGPVGFQVD